MARKVLLHIGLPKTGTTYLQTIMWDNRERLRDHGVLLPGLERRDHLWSSLVVRGDPNVARRNRLAPGAWDRVRQEVGDWSGTAVISHEFFCSASAEQAADAVAALAPAEVHVVVTAREALGLFTASWQESIKNKGTTPIGEYGRTESPNPLVIWDWRALDLGLVLERWGPSVPPERLHVLPLPRPGSPRELLWERFAGLLEVDPHAFDLDRSFPNESMGVVETETLRRVNQVLTGFDSALDRGVWIRSYLADERLVPRRGEKYWPGPDQIADCRARADRAVALVRERGYHVVGELENLRVPEELPERRHPDSVTDAEVAEVAVETIAVMLADVRRLDREARTARRKSAARRAPATRPATRPASRGGGVRAAVARIPGVAAAYRALRSRRSR
ncbi:MAG TPA: hypothetical protein VF049_08090 [Nocardioidaceae bacterium]|jgi:hypothetical protein